MALCGTRPLCLHKVIPVWPTGNHGQSLFCEAIIYFTSRIYIKLLQLIGLIKTTEIIPRRRSLASLNCLLAVIRVHCISLQQFQRGSLLPTAGACALFIRAGTSHRRCIAQYCHRFSPRWTHKLTSLQPLHTSKTLTYGRPRSGPAVKPRCSHFIAAPVCIPADCIGIGRIWPWLAVKARRFCLRLPVGIPVKTYWTFIYVKLPVALLETSGIISLPMTRVRIWRDGCLRVLPLVSRT